LALSFEPTSKNAVWRTSRSGLPRSASIGLKRSSAGFTLIELIVVFAILALLISLAVPRYFAHIERAKEATLRQDLSVMRDAIDKFYSDKGRYPDALEELVKERYIREVPTDPLTESASSWMVLPPADSKEKGLVYDVKSGAEGKSADGKPYSEW
jgi:general secretion pathway protein G